MRHRAGGLIVGALRPRTKLKEELGESRRGPLMKEGIEDPAQAGRAPREDEFLVAIRKSERGAG